MPEITESIKSFAVGKNVSGLGPVFRIQVIELRRVISILGCFQKSVRWIFSRDSAFGNMNGFVRQWIALSRVGLHIIVRFPVMKSENNFGRHAIASHFLNSEV